VDILR